MVGQLADVITYAKFQDDIFRGYDCTGGRISHFPIDFCMGLTTVQRDCAACDIGNSHGSHGNPIGIGSTIVALAKWEWSWEWLGVNGRKRKQYGPIFSRLPPTAVQKGPISYFTQSYFVLRTENGAILPLLLPDKRNFQHSRNLGHDCAQKRTAVLEELLVVWDWRQVQWNWEGKGHKTWLKLGAGMGIGMNY